MLYSPYLTFTAAATRLSQINFGEFNFKLCYLESLVLSHLFDALGDDFTDAEFDELTRETGNGRGSFEFNKMYDFVKN